jgi:hypothetical protein
MTLTKLVKLEWNIERSEDMYLAGKAINDRFIAEGKTDGVWEKNPDVEFGGQWKLLDQASAEEFIAELAAADLAYGRILVSSSITDL